MPDPSCGCDTLVGAGESILVEIIVRLRNREIYRFELKGDRATVGRSPDCEITIDNPAVSRRHFRFEYDGRGFLVRDLGSANGIFVNGKRVQMARVKHGTDVVLGKFTLQLIHLGAVGAPDQRDPQIERARNPQNTTVSAYVANGESTIGLAPEEARLLVTQNVPVLVDPRALHAADQAREEAATEAAERAAAAALAADEAAAVAADERRRADELVAERDRDRARRAVRATVDAPAGQFGLEHRRPRRRTHRPSSLLEVAPKFASSGADDPLKGVMGLLLVVVALIVLAIII